jgi:site-specific DNA recombinase
MSLNKKIIQAVQNTLLGTEEQRDAGTIQTRRESLGRYAAQHGFEVAEVYADDGVSGAIPLHERSEGRRLLEAARAGKDRHGARVQA